MEVGAVRRVRLLVVASTVSMIGWGAILPYQYAYSAESRGWGGMVAASASSLFSPGALLSAPFGGRLADQYDPTAVAVVAKLVAAAATAGMVVASTPLAFLVAMTVFGLGLTASAPAQSVLAVRWTSGEGRRRAFAWQFTGQALGMALGAFVAGRFVDLDRPDGMVPAFVLGAAGFLVSAALLALAGWMRTADGRPGHGVLPAAGADESLAAADAEEQPTTATAVRTILASRALRWTALIEITLALGFYAQFESGLPAYALTVLHVDEQTIGTAAAANCVVIVALQWLVVRFTGRRDAATLLIAVGLIWVVAWLVLAAGALTPALAAGMFVMTFAVFAVGETMYAPVLNPLVASLAPAGMVGTTLGAFAALQTGVSAAGPLLAGVALGAGHSTVFVVFHVAVSAVAAYAAWRLRSILRTRREPAADTPVRLPEPAAALS